MALIEVACFWCVAEMCSHEPDEPGKMKHPAAQRQPKSITAYQGTPVCGSCAMGIGQRLAARLAGLNELEAIPVQS